MFLTLFWLFLFGCAIDILWCLSIQASSSFKSFQATLYTVLLTSIQMWANWQVIKNDSLGGFLFFVAGCALGTFLATNKSVRRIWKK